MFPEAKTLEYFGLWDRNTVEDWKEQFTENIRIIKTPGHNYDSITLLVKTDDGIVAICGDVFWKEDFPKDDPYASDKEKLEESRKKVLEMADYIIPGHGKMFKVEK
jgi:glyoxylase-like metal-dependent hydrolase (beta-lactamase superfamily II)